MSTVELYDKLQKLTTGNLSREDIDKGIKELKDEVEMKIPQNEPLVGMEMNDAGGYSFKVEGLNQLKRFLILGTESGTFYTKPQDLLNQNVTCLVGLIKERKGLEALKVIKEISISGRAPKDDPALLCLAICATWEFDKILQKAAYGLVTIICNIPPKLFTFVQNCQRIINRKRAMPSFEPKPQLKRKRQAQPVEPAGDADSGPTPPKRGKNNDGKNNRKKVNTDPKRSSSWGRLRRKSVGAFYSTNKKDANELLYHLTKYKQRHNWTHKQVIRLCHPKMSGPEKIEKDLVITYCVRGFEAYQNMAENVATNESIDEIINNINVVEIVNKLVPEKQGSLDMLMVLLKQYGTRNTAEENIENKLKEDGTRKKPFTLVREHIPNGFLKTPQVWELMLQDMPMLAMLRNLGKMTALGLFEEGNENCLNTAVVVSKLTKVEMLQKARIHPMKILIAMKTYEAGKGIQGERENERPKKNANEDDNKKSDEQKSINTWKPNKFILQALDDAFYKSFKQPELKKNFQTGKKFMLALDVSGSMTVGGCIGCEAITPAVASSALAMMTWNIEENCEIYGFGGRLQNLKGTVLRKEMTVLQAMKAMSRLNFGSTDCALPIMKATAERINIDCFIVYTDNDTYIGKMHPCKALVKYRKEVNPGARLIVCAMTSNGFSIADPSDEGMLDIVGFDGSVPDIISRFAKAEI